MVGDRVNFSFAERGKLAKQGGITLVIRSKEAPLFNKIETRYILPCTDLKSVHPVVKPLFTGKAIRLESWKILIKNLRILFVVQAKSGRMDAHKGCPHQGGGVSQSRQLLTGRGGGLVK